MREAVGDQRRAKENVRHVKGSHIVVPRVHAEDHAYILQNADKRIVFVIPYQDALLADRHHRRAGRGRSSSRAISDDEIDYLLDARQHLPRASRSPRADVVWTFSGVRPLYDDGASDPSAITRDYVFKLDTGDAPGRARRCCRSSAARSPPTASSPSTRSPS